MKNQFNNRKIEPDFFDEFKGTTIEVSTKFLENGVYYIYKGVLVKRGKNFIYIRDGEVYEAKGNERKKISDFSRIALNKTIVSFVNFI